MMILSYSNYIPLQRLTSSIQVNAAPPALVQVPGPPFEQHVGHIGVTVLNLASDGGIMMIVSFSNDMSNQLQCISFTKSDMSLLSHLAFSINLAQSSFWHQ